MTRKNTAPSKLLEMAMQEDATRRLIAADERLVNCSGEFPEIIPLMTVPYECTVCLGKVMLEHSVVEFLGNLVGCPYCYEMRYVDDYEGSRE